jgi:hypothetical protein
MFSSFCYASLNTYPTWQASDMFRDALAIASFGFPGFFNRIIGALAILKTESGV